METEVCYFSFLDLHCFVLKSMTLPTHLLLHCTQMGNVLYHWNTGTWTRWQYKDGINSLNLTMEIDANMTEYQNSKHIRTFIQMNVNRSRILVSGDRLQSWALIKVYCLLLIVYTFFDHS